MTAGLEKQNVLRRIPLGRFGEPAEVAHAVLFLLESPYITGQLLLVDGGLQLALWWFLPLNHTSQLHIFVVLIMYNNVYWLHQTLMLLITSSSLCLIWVTHIIVKELDWIKVIFSSLEFLGYGSCSILGMTEVTGQHVEDMTRFVMSFQHLNRLCNITLTEPPTLIY